VPTGLLKANLKLLFDLPENFPPKLKCRHCGYAVLLAAENSFFFFFLFFERSSRMEFFHQLIAQSVRKKLRELHYGFQLRVNVKHD